MSIMLRAVSTSKSVRGCFAAVGLVVLGCGGADGSVAPPPAPPLIPPHLTIDVRYLSALTADQKNVISAAADKWTHALLTDMGSFQLSSASNDCFNGEPAVHELHHNLLLFVSVAHVDGPNGTLAYTEICGQSGNLLPIVSHIRIDADDLASLVARGLLSPVVTHEMGHALGFTSHVWAGKALVGGGFSDPYFTGLAAKTEFARHIPSYAGNPVPLEDIDQLGTKSSHWRWAVFGDELMVGALVPGYHYPLSSVTLGLFRDIGYDVDMKAAEPYTALSLMAGRSTPARTMLDGDLIRPRNVRQMRPVVLR